MITCPFIDGRVRDKSDYGAAFAESISAFLALTYLAFLCCLVSIPLGYETEVLSGLAGSQLRDGCGRFEADFDPSKPFGHTLDRETLRRPEYETDRAVEDRSENCKGNAHEGPKRVMSRSCPGSHRRDQADEQSKRQKSKDPERHELRPVTLATDRTPTALDRVHAFTTSALRFFNPKASLDSPHPPRPGLSIRIRSPFVKRTLNFPGRAFASPDLPKDWRFADGATAPPAIPRGLLAAIGQQRHFGVGQDFDFAHHAVAAAILAGARRFRDAARTDARATG